MTGKPCASLTAALLAMLTASALGCGARTTLVVPAEAGDDADDTDSASSPGSDCTHAEPGEACDFVGCCAVMESGGGGMLGRAVFTEYVRCNEGTVEWSSYPPAICQRDPNCPSPLDVHNGEGCLTVPGMSCVTDDDEEIECHGHTQRAPGDCTCEDGVWRCTWPPCHG
jgi:hypothetical protein